MSLLTVQNPNALPTLEYTAFCDFQGDLKSPMTPAALTKMRNSLIKHGVFVPKFVWFDEAGNANILDGHQTKQGLASLEADGWEIPPIPYVTVEAASREDAAEKLLQINSAYAKVNPQTTWLDTFDFPDVAVVLEDIEIPELNIDNLVASVPFAVPSQPYYTTSANYANIPPSQDRQMQPTPLERWDDNSQGFTAERGRIIIVYQDNEQRQWLADRLGISCEKIIYPVTELRGF